MSGFAAIVLAAGRSTRMGAENKLLADLCGEPLIARTLANATGSRARPIIVVTGHMAQEVRTALGPDSPTVVHNAAHATGMASSIRTGLGAISGDAEGAIILLGDMPLISSSVIDSLIGAAEARPEAAAIVPTVEGEWAHPVLIRRRLFAEMMALVGDAGARRILTSRPDVATVPVDDSGCLMDADDPEALAGIRRAFALRSRTVGR